MNEKAIFWSFYTWKSRRTRAETKILVSLMTPSDSTTVSRSKKKSRNPPEDAQMTVIFQAVQR